MRLNQYIAQASGLSRRAADTAISEGRVSVNGATATLGQQVTETDSIRLDGQILSHTSQHTIMLNKPVGYVCSRNGQGSKTIYDLLPAELHHLKPVGRLDKDSSGLLLLTNDGQLAQQLTHPSFEKTKIYEIVLDIPLTASAKQQIEQGIMLEDGLSRLKLTGEARNWTVTMHEGRNRQIRRTFAALGYTVSKLHRLQFGPYQLKELSSGKFDYVRI